MDVPISKASAQGESGLLVVAPLACQCSTPNMFLEDWVYAFYPRAKTPVDVKDAELLTWLLSIENLHKTGTVWIRILAWSASCQMNTSTKSDEGL